MSLETTIAEFVTSNPVWVGSSELTMGIDGIVACAEAGAGAVVAKSVNETAAARAQLAIADYVWIDSARRPADNTNPDVSLLNRSGLADASLDDWIAMLGVAEERARAAGSAVIGSITVASADGAAEIARRMRDVVGAVELNVGAPHGREAGAGAIRQLTEADAVRKIVTVVRARGGDGPLLVKLPGTSSDVVALARAAVIAGADAVTFMGRFNGFLPDVETAEPLLGSRGAYGGAWALPIVLDAISRAHADREVGVPIIGTNGARDADDVVRFLLSGASAVELVDVVWRYGPRVLSSIIAGVADRVSASGFESPTELIGIAADRVRAYTEIPPGARPEPWARHVRGD